MAIPKELETPLYESMWNALIEATPEWWKAAVLVVVWKRDSTDVESFEHIISSPEGHREPVAATDEIIDATMRLADLYVQHGHRWKRVEFGVEQSADGDWSCRVAYEY